MCGINISNDIYDGTDNSYIDVFSMNNPRLIVLYAENCGNSKDYKLFSEIQGELPWVGV
jgi:hypothetical protein